MFPSRQPFFIDETKSRGFAFAVATLPQSELRTARMELRSLCASGQRSLHFKHESPRKRRSILAVIARQGWRAAILQSRQSNMRLARTECLYATITLAHKSNAPAVILELDTSVERYDRQDLFEHCRHIGMDESFRYDLRPRHSEPGLWVADAVAWCFARGGPWRRQIGSLLVAVQET